MSQRTITTCTSTVYILTDIQHGKHIEAGLKYTVVSKLKFF